MGTEAIGGSKGAPEKPMAEPKPRQEPPPPPEPPPARPSSTEA